MMIAGAIAFATATLSAPMTASAHGVRHHHTILRGAALGNTRHAASRARFAYGMRSRAGLRHAGLGRHGAYRVARGGYHVTRHGYRVARRGYGRVHLRTASVDRQIQQYVGPQASYAPASTATGGYVQTGAASYYSLGGRTAAGGSVGAATCAHRSLPFGTKVLVTNLTNAHQAVLTVNDRGPFVRGRVIDVSKGAAGVLGMLGAGVAHVRLQVLGGPG